MKATDANDFRGSYFTGYPIDRASRCRGWFRKLSGSRQTEPQGRL